MVEKYVRSVCFRFMQVDLGLVGKEDICLHELRIDIYMLCFNLKYEWCNFEYCIFEGLVGTSVVRPWIGR